LIFAVISVIALIVVTAFFLIRGYTWERAAKQPSFELLMVVGTIVLPQLSPLLID
jgi:hypothetical protein